MMKWRNFSGNCFFHRFSREMAKNVIDIIKKEDQDDVDDVEIEVPEE